MLDIYNKVKLFIYEHKIKLIICFSIIVFLIALPILFVLSKDSKIVYDEILPNNLEEENLEQGKKEEIVIENEYFYVDIKGYVNNPGVYSVLKGKRVVDVINQAGGLKEGADTALLNLSLEVFDSMVIVIYSTEEVNNLIKLKEETKVKEEICTLEIKNDACICNSNDNINNNSNIEDEILKKEENKETNNNLNNTKININKATLEELISLPKIGESKAKAIIDYRLEFGNFKDILEIKNVSGIGDSLFESIKNYITV